MPRKRRTRVDQLTVQEAVRTAARRALVWARSGSVGPVHDEDERFVEELVHLVRRYERILPTREARIRPRDRGLEQRITAVVDGFTAVIKEHKKSKGIAKPAKELFTEFSDVLREHEFELTPSEITRAFKLRFGAGATDESIDDLATDFSGSPKMGARECVAVLELDAGVSARNQRLREKRAQLELPPSRQVTIEELIRYSMCCCGIGPRTAKALAGVVDSAYRQGRLDSRYWPARYLLQGFFSEPVRSRAAFPSSTRANRASVTAREQ